MKTKWKIAVAAVIGSAVAGFSIGEPQLLKEEYGGWLARKAMDYEGRPLWIQTTYNGGMESSLDKFTTASYLPWDQFAPEPDPEDTYAEGTTYLWWGDGEQKQLTAFDWSITFSGNYKRTPHVIEGSAGDPVGVSFIWGLETSPDGLTHRLGAFHYSMANLGHLKQNVELEVDWETWIGEPDQTTRHRMTVEPGQLRSIWPHPNTDRFGVARFINLHKEAK